LVDALKPGSCPNHKSLNPEEAEENAALAQDTAHEVFRIPKILDPEDLTGPNMDERSLMTYLAYFKNLEKKNVWF